MRNRGSVPTGSYLRPSCFNGPKNCACLPVRIAGKQHDERETGRGIPATGAISTASRALTRLAHERAIEANIEVGPLLRKAGLTLAQVNNSSLRLNVTSQTAFLDLAAEGLGDELFGFHLAQDFDLPEIGTLYFIMASETLGDALQRAARYNGITNEALHLRYQTSRDIVVTGCAANL
jgi:Arabinose-binding domain of AraC transcription regulator, N-term